MTLTLTKVFEMIFPEINNFPEIKAFKTDLEVQAFSFALSVLYPLAKTFPIGEMDGYQYYFLDHKKPNIEDIEAIMKEKFFSKEWIETFMDTNNKVLKKYMLKPDICCSSENNPYSQKKEEPTKYEQEAGSSLLNILENVSIDEFERSFSTGLLKILKEQTPTIGILCRTPLNELFKVKGMGHKRISEVKIFLKTIGLPFKMY